MLRSLARVCAPNGLTILEEIVHFVHEAIVLIGEFLAVNLAVEAFRYIPRPNTCDCEHVDATNCALVGGIDIVGAHTVECKEIPAVLDDCPQ